MPLHKAVLSGLSIFAAQRVFAGAVFLSIAMIINAAAAQIYTTGFEPSDSDGNSYQADQSISQYSGWTLQSGIAVITASEKKHGQQSLLLNAAGTNVAVVDRPISSSSASALQGVIWVQAWFRGQGSEIEPPAYPEATPASSIVHFSKSRGILLLNGPKASETWTSTTVSGSNFDSTRWYQITLRQDYKRQEWDCYIDGAKQNASALKFRDSVPQLKGFLNLADAPSYVDTIRVISPLTGDANGDSILDLADLVVTINLANNNSVALDTIFGGNADIAGASGDTTPDGQIDSQDIDAIAKKILGH